MITNCLYDIHCHSFNLSHPNYSAFIKRFNIDRMLFLATLPIIKYFVIGSANKAINLISLMNRDLAEYFQAMEDDLKNFIKNSKIKIGKNYYDKLIITPLMMDFSYKDSETYPDTHYGRPPTKPIREQLIDLFYGIKNYKPKEQGKWLEIYPFLGLSKIDDDHYTLEQIKTMFEKKYFKNFKDTKPEDRYKKLYKQMGDFDGDIEHLKNYSFAGVKMYPPLGFNPWPDEQSDLKKVKYIYDYCQGNSIPITTHCGGNGFLTIKKEDALKYANPESWRIVLENYPELKINFAHFGGDIKRNPIEWAIEIARLIDKYDNVYTDISCQCFDNQDYRKLSKSIQKLSDEYVQKDKLLSRILFGTDFMINLIKTDSYLDYIKVFSEMETDNINNKEKDLFCSKNPARFIFPGIP